MTQPPLWTYPNGWLRARFLKREKRFIVYAEALEGPLQGQTLKAHLADPGRLPGILTPDRILWLQGPFPPPRKLSWSVKLAERSPERWLAIDTQLAHHVVPRLIEQACIPGLPPHETLQREVKRGDSRLDLLWPLDEGHEFWAEIKTVSMLFDDGLAAWPDAPSTRGRKHLQHLIDHANEGHPAALIFLVVADGVTTVHPAAHVDPAFATLLVQAHEAGVQLLAHAVRPTPQGIFNEGPVQVSTTPISPPSPS